LKKDSVCFTDFNDLNYKADAINVSGERLFRKSVKSFLSPADDLCKTRSVAQATGSSLAPNWCRPSESRFLEKEGYLQRNCADGARKCSQCVARGTRECQSQFRDCRASSRCGFGTGTGAKTAKLPDCCWISAMQPRHASSFSFTPLERRGKPLRFQRLQCAVFALCIRPRGSFQSPSSP
jgi:hypothetical protein